jgi:hypothetical protein
VFPVSLVCVSPAEKSTLTLIHHRAFSREVLLAAAAGEGQDTCAPGVACKRVAPRAGYTPCP